MPNTLKYAITYPSGTAAPNVPLVMQTLAESTEAAITAVDIKMRHAEYTSTVVTTAAGSARFVGALSADATKTFNNTFVVPDVAGKVKFTEAGVYAVHYIALPAAQQTSNNIQINLNTSTQVASTVAGNYGSANISVGASNYYFAVNDILDFTILLSGVTTVGSRVCITKLHA